MPRGFGNIWWARRRSSTGTCSVALLVLVLLLSGCSDSATSTPSRESSRAAVDAEAAAGAASAAKQYGPESWAAFAEEFVDATHKLLPHVAVAQGLHEFDGVQTDFSSAGITRRINHFRAAMERAPNYELLDSDQRFDRDLLLWYAGQAIFQLERAQTHKTNIVSYFDAISFPRISETTPLSNSTGLCSLCRYKRYWSST